MPTIRLRQGNHINRVIPLLSFVALIALWWLDFASYQPNRIAPGTGMGILEGLGIGWTLFYTLGLITLTVIGWHARALTLYAGLALTTGLLAALPFTLTAFATLHIPADQPFARTGLGAGFWTLLFLLSLLLVDGLQRLRAGPLLRITLTLLLLMSLAFSIITGRMDELALLKEYGNRSDQFATALRHHLLLVGGAVGTSLVIGFILAIQLLNRPHWQKPVIGVLSFFQTIPSLALFGLLIAPLSYLSAQWPWLQQFGIRGIGWAPAVLALIGYSLLPMVRNTWVALAEVPEPVLDAARGMGMSRLQSFIQVRLPLALPVMLEGVRITSIQAIGLTAVAALIGAGGFGTFIFQGLGQAANELILLGAIPTIGLALLADMLFTGLAALTRRHEGSTA